MGLQLRNPILAASSGLTNDIHDILELEKFGAGAIVLKSIFEEEIRIEMEKDMAQMNKATFLYPETMDFYDNFNQVDDELTKYLTLISDAKQKTSIPVVASINCVTAEKWPYYASILQDAGADALELNVFTLPTNFEAKAEETEKLYFDIVTEVKKHVNIPVSLKISFYSTNLGALIKKLSATGIRGLVLFNRYYNPDIDTDNFSVISSHVLSTPEELPLSLRWIAIMSHRVECDLAATTGIHSGKAVIKQLLAGASAVQIASVLYKKGKKYLEVMLKDISTWMDEKGYKTIDEFKGKVSQSAIHDPAAYERVQFMRYFAGKGV